MKQTETEKKVKSSSAAKKSDSKKRKKAQKNAEPVFQKPWETHMQEVYGRSVSLSHPAIEPGEVTAEYGISPSSFPLQAGFTVMPTGNGQVGAYYDKTSGRQGSMFGVIGGMAEFAPPNLKGVKVLAQLDTFNLIADKEAETENEDDSETESPLNAAPQIDKIALPALDMQQQSMPMMDKITLPALDAAELEQQGIAQMDEIALPPSESETLQQFTPQIDQITLPPPDMAAIQEETLEPQQENAPLGETKISAYLKGALVIEPYKGFKMELDEAEYIKHDNETEILENQADLSRPPRCAPIRIGKRRNGFARCRQFRYRTG